MARSIALGTCWFWAWGSWNSEDSLFSSETIGLPESRGEQEHGAGDEQDAPRAIGGEPREADPSPPPPALKPPPQ